MKILIVSMLFQPDNRIGSVRPTNFAKWLENFGHQVDVITINPEAPALTQRQLKVFFVSNGKYVSKILNNTYGKTTLKDNVLLGNMGQTRKENNQSSLKGSRTFLLSWIQYFDLKNQCLKQISISSQQNQYDIVFSSFGPIGSYWLGHALYKRKVAKYWVSDLRDLMISETLPSWLNKIYRYYQKQMIKEADAITVVSDGAARILCDQFCKNERQKQKVHKINNGYEVNENPIDNKGMIAKDDILRICYTGTLYAGQRDMALLFEAISEIIREKMVEAEKIEVHYAGGESEELLWQAKSYDMDQRIVNHGVIPRSDALLLQNASDIMVVLSWNTTNEQGILPGKFYEYLAAEKPIISIISGDLPKGELSNLVSDMNLGIACEYTSRQKDLGILKEYILKCYECKEKGENIPFNPRKEMVAEYRYDKLSRKLESLFCSLVKE